MIYCLLTGIANDIIDHLHCSTISAVRHYAQGITKPSTTLEEWVILPETRLYGYSAFLKDMNSLLTTLWVQDMFESFS